MQTFFIIWLGQVVSVLGTYITDFALGVWVYQQTGSITQFAMTIVFMHLPNLMVSAFAGVLVDRWNRKWIMLASDFSKSVMAVILIVLATSNQLEVWHIYIAVSLGSFCTGFQWPAYTAAIAQLVPKQNLSRANGMVQISRAVARILGPTIAGFLVQSIGIRGVLLLNFCTFSVSIISLLAVHFPDVQASIETRVKTSVQSVAEKTASLALVWDEVTSGWNYVAERPGLYRLILFTGIIYLTEGVVQVVFWPLVLSFGSSSELGIVLSISGCGMLFGSIAVSAWGGRLGRRVYGILVFVGLQGLCLCLGGFKASIVVAAIGGFGYLFAQPIIISSSQTIWQCKIPINLQGRIFALQSLIERSAMISTQLTIGPLVDRLFEPMMAENGLLADSVGKMIGVGPGRGIALLLILLGMVNIGASIVAYRTPRLRRVEKELPDAIASNVVSG
ncbi:MFS transporter [Limnoraphis robusta Tam1]|jgi:DHA3 family macrolide efflux protein-like MFS transporter|uniref:MFS transporter n=1 Tax=Limnoraphis robusta CCNP1315 TaxID=3110306 RepID=A0ABU5U5I3_9CYAN|nr:MFS transporter [Limnoraphis robusta]MCG5059271.1 MFS transporter [Limnoraphis sp. WC205]MEA5496734.1 MFS transporter [Limnoraphis robusta BA-68 BA1]MEA5522442.1 MFS transporter [Limnoraphis robusta CCNP1315]MEA5541585.1 MFS transporter [Limnoraphis robusta Tam1]MEA5546201.1 MFS transporter [Limnoraphis robusta CCNP1324]